MIDVDNYKRAIGWLRDGLDQLDREPRNEAIQLSVLHSFGVTYNLSEGILREGYVSLGNDEDAAYLSTRELIRRARDKGIFLSSPKQWMVYGLALESIREGWMSSAQESLGDVLPILPQFVRELDAFARCLEERLAPLA